MERYVYYPADRRLLRRFPMVIAVSSDLRNSLVESGLKADRVRTVLNGIDPDRFRRDPSRIADFRQSLGLSPGEIALGGVGRVERQKRFDVLLRAFALLLPRQPLLRLFIVGEGSLRGELEQLARNLNVAHACRFLGHRSDLERIYPALDVYVQSSDYEGTPNVVLEAMAFETPIVATDVGGTTELVGHKVHAWVVPPRNPEALAGRRCAHAPRRGATSARVAAARARIERELSFDARMKTVEGIYEELMIAHGHRRRAVIDRKTSVL